MLSEEELNSEVIRFKNLGIDNLCSAMILWSLGLLSQSIWSLQSSLECYLKAIWISNKNFANIDELQSRLRKLSPYHDLGEIFNKLDKEHKGSMIEKGFSAVFIKPGTVRYLDEGFGYSSTTFNQMIEAIRVCREILGESKQINIIDHILKGRFNDKDEIKKSLKYILNNGFPNITKRKREYRKAIKKLIELNGKN